MTLQRGRTYEYIKTTYQLSLSIIAALLHWKTIHTKSPQEYVVEAWWTSTLDLWARTQKVATRWYRPMFHPPVHRCVRVKLFSGNVSRILDDTCLFADFYLDDGGNLNLKLVRQRWNLAAIQVIVYSPGKGLNLFIPRNLDFMPARHVDALKGRDGCIRIIETPSNSVVKIRDHRARLMEFYEDHALVFTLLFIAFSMLVFGTIVYALFYGSWLRLDSFIHLMRVCGTSRFLRAFERAEIQHSF